MADAGHYITMPVEMIQRLRTEADDQERSVSWLVRRYITDAWKASDADSPAESKVEELMANLAQSVTDAKAARQRKLEADAAAASGQNLESDRPNPSPAASGEGSDR